MPRPRRRIVEEDSDSSDDEPKVRGPYTLAGLLEEFFNRAIEVASETEFRPPRCLFCLYSLNDVLGKLGQDESSSVSRIRVRMDNNLPKQPAKSYMRLPGSKFCVAFNDTHGTLSVMYQRSIVHHKLSPLGFRHLQKYCRLDLMPINVRKLEPNTIGYDVLVKNEAKLYRPKYYPSSVSLGQLDAQIAAWSDAAFKLYWRTHWHQVTNSWLHLEEEISQKQKRTWWAMAELELDCDGYNEKFALPNALARDLEQMEKSLNNSKHQRHVSYSQDMAEKRQRVVANGPEFEILAEDDADTTHVTEPQAADTTHVTEPDTKRYKADSTRPSTADPCGHSEQNSRGTKSAPSSRRASPRKTPVAPRINYSDYAPVVIVSGHEEGRYFEERFRKFKRTHLGRVLWCMLALGFETLDLSTLVYEAPTVFWNVLLMGKDNPAAAILECVKFYRPMAQRDPFLNRPQVQDRGLEFLSGRLRPRRTVRVRRSVLQRGAAEEIGLTPVEGGQSIVTPPLPPHVDDVGPGDDEDYDRIISEELARRVVLYYVGGPRYHRKFEAGVIPKCRCHRCVLRIPKERLLESVTVPDLEGFNDSSLEELPQMFLTDIKKKLEMDLEDLSSENDTTNILREQRELRTPIYSALRDLINRCLVPDDLRQDLEALIDQKLLEGDCDKDKDHQKPRRDRMAALGDCDDLDLATAKLTQYYLDTHGFPKRSVFKISAFYRKLLYQICADGRLLAPILVGKNEKGRALYAAAPIYKGDFVCEYEGVYYSQTGLAKARERDHAAQGRGSYMFFFVNPATSKNVCIDSTAESAAFGPARLINHSHRQPNLEASVVTPSVYQKLDKQLKNNAERQARLVFFACRDIQIGEELLIDYGETDPKTLAANPWLLE